MRVTIKDIAYYLPEQVVDNNDIHNENPDWGAVHVGEKVGVLKRHIARDDETALDLSLLACEKLFQNNAEVKEKIDGIIFCTQSEDHIMPPNSCILQGKLGLGENVFAFDFNLACSGYIYGLALATGLIMSGVASNILLVNADTYSKYISKKDRSARMLFGDGAAVSWVAGSGQGDGIVDIQCASNGKHFDKFIIPAGGCRMPKTAQTSVCSEDDNGNFRSLENIHMDGMGILTFVNSRVPSQIRSILGRNKLNVEDIDLFVFHQASKIALDSLVRLLKIDPKKMVVNISEVGNTVSASIPIALKSAIENGRIKNGGLVLLSGFGVGLSWGTAIVRI